MAATVRESIVTCPRCGDRTAVEMPENACVYYRDCPACGATFGPLPGDCCVFCSYGSVPCPSVQRQGGLEKARRARS